MWCVGVRKRNGLNRRKSSWHRWKCPGKHRQRRATRRRSTTARRWSHSKALAVELAVEAVSVSREVRLLVSPRRAIDAIVRRIGEVQQLLRASSYISRMWRKSRILSSAMALHLYIRHKMIKLTSTSNKSKCSSNHKKILPRTVLIKFSKSQL